MSRVKSNSSPILMLSLLAISVAATIAVVPFWDTVAMSGTLFWTSSIEPVSAVLVGMGRGAYVATDFMLALTP